jgi:hypothetical protein
MHQDKNRLFGISATHRLLLSVMAVLFALVVIVSVLRMRGRSDSRSKTPSLLRV